MNNTLSQAEIDAFIQEKIVPAFQPLFEKDIKTALWGRTGDVITATNKLANSLGFANADEMKGLSIRKLLIHNKLKPLIEQFPLLHKIFSSVEFTPEREALPLEIINKLNNLKEEVFDTATPVNAILIHPYQIIHKTALLVQYVPIFHSNGEVIAVQSYLRNFNMFGIHDYLSGYETKHLDVPKVLMNNNELPLGLTQRQYEVIFLLTIGMTQKQTAEILNLGRGTIAKMVSDTICPKFGIYDANSHVLINKAKEMNLHKSIPMSLCKPWVIVLSDDE